MAALSAGSVTTRTIEPFSIGADNIADKTINWEHTTPDVVDAVMTSLDQLQFYEKMFGYLKKSCMQGEVRPRNANPEQRRLLAMEAKTGALLFLSFSFSSLPRSLCFPFRFPHLALIAHKALDFLQNTWIPIAKSGKKCTPTRGKHEATPNPRPPKPTRPRQGPYVCMFRRFWRSQPGYDYVIESFIRNTNFYAD
jgi:hypothetical protein